MTHPVVYAIGLGVAIGAAIYAYFARDNLHHQNHHNNMPPRHWPPPHPPPPPQQPPQPPQPPQQQQPPPQPQPTQQPQPPTPQPSPQQPRQNLRIRYNSDELCTVCCEGVPHDSPSLNCGHVFHIECLLGLEKNICPNCEYKF